MDAGKLTLTVTWDGHEIRAAEVRSTRPLAAKVLAGKTPAQVTQIVPLLFSVCGRAQGAAAAAALQAAQGGTDQILAATGRQIACEAMQEHLWRLMLDWPRLLGLPQQQQEFAAWYALLRKVAAGEVPMAAFRQEFERDALGMSAAAWLRRDAVAVRDWWRDTRTPLAQTLSKLAGLESGRQDRAANRLLPAWSAAEVQQACSGHWDADFAAQPEWQGAAAEAGAWGYHAASPLLQQGGTPALTRLLARLVDVAELACEHIDARLDAASPAAGEGVAVARTARGPLLHHVRLQDGKVADYTIVAPTEWNFHPHGAFVRDLCGVKEHERERVQQWADIAALSLDPCVAYEIEVIHA